MAFTSDRFRGRIVLTDAMEPGAQTAPETQSARNITDSYDQHRLAQVQFLLIKDSTHGGHGSVEQTARTYVISVSDAIRLSKNDDYKTAADLSDTQKKLIEIVAREHKSGAGRKLLKEAEKRDEWLAVDNNTPYGGTYHAAPENLTAISLKNDALKIDHTNDIQISKRTLHHEEIHGHQQKETDKIFKTLNSLGQKRWELGRESQAYAAVEDERRRDNGEPPMTNSEKRKFFSHLLSGGISQEKLYTDYYQVTNTPHTGGRELTLKEFEKEFGTIPGHKGAGNFLKGGHYENIDEIYDADLYSASPLGRALNKANWLTYQELPKAKSNATRLESDNKDHIIYVTYKKGSHDTHIVIYKEEDRAGEKGYIKMLDETDHLVPPIKGSGQAIGLYEVNFRDDGGKAKNFSVFVGEDGKIHANGSEQDNTSGAKRDYHFQPNTEATKTPASQKKPGSALLTP